MVAERTGDGCKEPQDIHYPGHELDISCSITT
jgi:hypothetical protein